MPSTSSARVPTAARRRAAIWLALALGLGLGLLAGCASREERISEALERAERLLFEGETEKAAQLLQRRVRDFPDHAELRQTLGSALVQAGDQAAALEAYERALEIDPSRDRLWVRIAELRMQLGRRRPAIEAFERYLANRGNDFLAWKNLSELSESIGDYETAIDAALEWHDARPSARPAFWLGQLFQASGNLPQARAWFAQAAAYESEPAAGDALLALIDLEISLRQYLQAETWLERLQEAFPEKARQPEAQEARQLLSKWRRAQQELAEAVSELEARRQRPGQGEGPRDADPAETEGDARAEAASEEAEAPLSAEARAEREGGRTGPADAAEERAGSRDPGAGERKPPSPLFGEPVVETPTGSAPDSTADRAARGADDASPAARARAALEASRHAEAIEAYWAALGSSPDSPRLWHGLALAYYRSGNDADAEACILEARRRAPDSESVSVSYIQILMRARSPSRAAEEAERLAERFPRNPRIAYLRARALRDARASPRTVSAAYRRFLDLAEPGAPGYREARRYLNAND